MKDETTTIIKRKNKREWVASSPHLFGHLKTGTSMWLQMTLWNKTLCRCGAWPNKKSRNQKELLCREGKSGNDRRTIIKRRIKREGVTSSQKNMKQDLNKIINRKNKREGGLHQARTTQNRILAPMRKGFWSEWISFKWKSLDVLCIVKFKIDGSQ